MSTEAWRMPVPLWWFPDEHAVRIPWMTVGPPGMGWRLSFNVWWKP